jgi:hypothetical protein
VAAHGELARPGLPGAQRGLDGGAVLVHRIRGVELGDGQLERGAIVAGEEDPGGVVEVAHGSGVEVGDADEVACGCEVERPLRVDVRDEGGDVLQGGDMADHADLVVEHRRESQVDPRGRTQPDAHGIDGAGGDPHVDLGGDIGVAGSEDVVEPLRCIVAGGGLVGADRCAEEPVPRRVGIGDPTLGGDAGDGHR